MRYINQSLTYLLTYLAKKAGDKFQNSSVWELNFVSLAYMQGRLHHINDGANDPWKSKGEGFCRVFQEIKGEAKISLLIVALISSANYHLIYCKWLT